MAEKKISIQGASNVNHTKAKENNSERNKENNERRIEKAKDNQVAQC